MSPGVDGQKNVKHPRKKRAGKKEKKSNKESVDLFWDRPPSWPENLKIPREDQGGQDLLRQKREKNL